MVERWFVSHIFLQQRAYRERDIILLDAIKPAVEILEKENLISTFHFLFEPNFEILFRVRLKEDADMEKVKSIISEKLKPIENLCSKIDHDENYHGEGDPEAAWSFGTEGWALTQKFLEYGSRITLLIREVEMERKPLSAGRLDSQFNIGKLVHCFLNQAGLDMSREANFHIARFFERMLRAYGYFDALEKLGEIEKRQVST
ncbi:MAG: lantibiotic dehydratase C-terminal domain-containing protein [Candidatus Bathyarchaeia archaeon]